VISKEDWGYIGAQLVAKEIVQQQYCNKMMIDIVTFCGFSGIVI
jgi:hypothetical protein